jgi:hypothetical protein
MHRERGEVQSTGIKSKHYREQGWGGGGGELIDLGQRVYSITVYHFSLVYGVLCTERLPDVDDGFPTDVSRDKQSRTLHSCTMRPLDDEAH